MRLLESEKKQALTKEQVEIVADYLQKYYQMSRNTARHMADECLETYNLFLSDSADRYENLGKGILIKEGNGDLYKGLTNMDNEQFTDYFDYDAFADYKMKYDFVFEGGRWVAKDNSMIIDIDPEDEAFEEYDSKKDAYREIFLNGYLDGVDVQNEVDGKLLARFFDFYRYGQDMESQYEFLDGVGWIAQYLDI